MNPYGQKARSIFLSAVENHAPDAWEAYLDEACAGDPELRQRVGVLLRAHEQPNSLLDHPPAAVAVEHGEIVVERPGMFVGPYRLMEQIGEGGMGLVFVAEQQQPVRRKVAVKVIKPGMDSRQVIARFEAERQALALMDHPHIAKVLDAGATASGRPYFVMELVKGKPITEYCDEHRLTPRERLGLFVDVCQAVQHAHQKGVIHRDLKPANVLVASHDGTPVAKVIDFGIAKAVGEPLTDKTVYTTFMQLIGTPLYMSPEQAGQSDLDIDTRTDIYALGVLLYELLTGTTPFDWERLRDVGYDEIRRIIREEDPPKPSARVSTLAQAATTVWDNRRSDPKRLGRLLRGDLDWIVMKALEKDRSRRYETANGLAMDVRRYLNDEPVLAGPPGAGYRLRKLVRRHRGPVLAGALLIAALLAGLAGTTWGMVRAEWAWQDAETARLGEVEARRQALARADAEARQRQRADDERDRAEEEKRVAEAVQRFLQIGLLRQADPFTQAEALRRAGGGFEARENPTVKELLDRSALELTADKVEARFPKQPRVQAEVLHTVGRSYLGVGEYQKAIAHLTRAWDLMSSALGPNHRHTLAALHSLAVAKRRAGKPAEAIVLFEKVHAAAAATLGPEHPSTLTTLDNLAGAYLEAGKTPRAIALFEEVRDARVAKLGANHLHTLITQDNLAAAYRKAGRPADAVALLERVRVAILAEAGPEHPSTLSALDNLAGAYREVGRTADAITLYEQVRAACEAKLGENHPHTLATLNNLAAAYWRAKHLDRSVPLFEETLRRSEDRLGPDHPDTLMTMANLGVNLRDAGKPAEGIALMEQALARARQRSDPMSAQLIWVPGMLADTYDRAGQFSQSERHYRWLVAQARSGGPGNAPKVAYLLNRLGLNLVRQRKGTEAEVILRESLAFYERNDPEAWKAFETKALIGGALLAQNKFAEADSLLRTGYLGMKERTAQIPPRDQVRLRDALDWLIELADTQRDKTAAENWRQERATLTP
jgi:serine/threonine protein kinase/tetratricopeptide (TPR) repeat protein